jgi:cytochrome c oxidase accessory protein FixG
VSVVLLAALFAAPWIRIGEEPLVLFNILERKFVLIGQVFWPQDFHLFAIAFISMVLFIVLFTVVWGRIWCGWLCPQTIFLEMVFRKIEYLIEGDSAAQRRLAKAPWNGEKILKRGTKFLVFLFVSFLVANTLMFYLIGTEKGLLYITHSPLAHPISFAILLGFTVLFFLIFARLRELACIIVCPYGRLQSVLLDANSVVISYDTVRGEPRGKLKKEPDPKLGDCIDCRQCVAVCPTGIDIRNGTQLECVNCTACIDACDEIMDKVAKPRGLIRYASLNMIQQKSKFRFTPRAIAYSVVLVLLLGVFTSMILLRTDVEATVLKAPGKLYTLTEAGEISNLYTVKVVNKSHDERHLTFHLAGDLGTIEKIGQDTLTLASGEGGDGAIMVKIPRDKMQGHSMDIRIEVFDRNQKVETVKTKFTGPFK